MLQRNLHEEVKARRKSEYKEWKKKVRELIEESKGRVNEELVGSRVKIFVKTRSSLGEK